MKPEELYKNGDFIEHAPVLREYSHGFVIELGPNTGDSSTRAIQFGLHDWMDVGGKDPLHIAVDIGNFMGINIPTVPWFHLIVGDSRERSTLEQAKAIAGDRKADIIFIDTIHEYQFIQRELPLWLEMADENTTWLFHDTWMLGHYNHMTDAIKEFAQTHPQWQYVDLSKTCNGFGALIPVK